MTVVQITDAPSHPDQQPHVAEHVMCVHCGAVLIDVRPVSCPIDICECKCGRVGTLEGLTKREVLMLSRISALEDRVRALDGGT